VNQPEHAAPHPTGTPEEPKRLVPGTYELTKRVEVNEDGVARFVDMPDGPDAEYIAGFWHKTRSTVRVVKPEGQRHTPCEETVERVAQAIHDTECGCGMVHGPYDWSERPDSYLAMARAAVVTLLGGTQ
jgi:hypothetical protein